MVILPQKISFSMESFSEFIEKHENDDTARLLLSGKIPDNIDAGLAADTIEVRRKLKKKVPSWYAHPELAFPLKLGAEQCSSEITARYKAAFVHMIFRRIADLTGGLGVDSWAFSLAARQVLYNEMNPVLAAAAKANFKALGADNIQVRSCRISAKGSSTVLAEESLDEIREDVPELTPAELLHDFRPDLVYLDPARRGDDGSKVFLPEQCSPDIISLKDGLFEVCRFILIKLSPMADINLLLKRLGDSCIELHILAAGGECKEILLLMDREHHGECSVTVASHRGNAAAEPECRFTFRGWSRMTFGMDELLAGPEALNPVSPDELSPGALLYEPGKALMKAGAFNALCRRFPLKKLGRFTHYYVTDPERAGMNGMPDLDSATDTLAGFGRFFTIRQVLPLNRQSIKDIGRNFPKAEVSARNIKMDTDTLRKKLGVSSGGDIHVFGLSCSLSDGNANLLIVSEPA